MSTALVDRFATARAVADAVLYEGYVLYPYRASSAKNQVRWQFGVLTPRSFSEVDGMERWSARTEVLVEAGSISSLLVRIRCLQVCDRTVEACVGDNAFARVESLEVDEKRYVEWEEAADRTVDLPRLSLARLAGTDFEEGFTFDDGEETEPLVRSDGAIAGRFVRRRQRIDGVINVSASAASGSEALTKVTVTVKNVTPWVGDTTRRDEVIAHSLVSVHTMLAVDDGRFVSLLDPPDNARPAVAQCRSEGAFPVLIGSDDVVLASPIILYDHPEVAPESPGDLYDATEIDEILALRVLTLTDEEKMEARGTDARAAAIIDRCDDMPPEIWERLHGALRSVGAGSDPVAVLHTPTDNDPDSAPWWDPAADASVDPWTDSVMVGGVDVTKGTAVRLRPSHRSDAQDLFFDGLRATVTGVFRDVDGAEHVAVSLDDDPAAEELGWQGRYLFFHPDEVEPLVSRDRPR